MAIEEEDFSFPATIADAQPRFIDSPPLWRPVSVPPPPEKPERLFDKQEIRETYNNNQRKNFSRGMKMERREEEDDYGSDELEEKMDMLWEDLNEEFSRKLVADSCMSSSDRDVQISRVKTLKLSKPNGNLLSGKKLSIVLLMKILMRKVFSVHNTRSSIKNGAC